MVFLSTLLASVLLTALAMPLLCKLAVRYSLVDIPNDRKVHSEPIPRAGGLAMAFGMVVPVSFWVGDQEFVKSFMTGAAILVLFGLLDDCCDLRPRWKLGGQIAAASIPVLGGGITICSVGTLAPDGFLLPSWFAVPFTIFVVVGVTNAINLSDGLDGLAGGISLLSLCCLGYLAYLERDTAIGIIALALAGATFGFLRYNTYPATIFMGDTGSQLLGFSTITLALSLTQGHGQLSPVLPLIILGFPILDTLTVMVRRMVAGRSPFSADKTHFHHALLALGLHQTESVMMIYLIQVSLVGAALVLRSYSDRLLLGGYVIFCLVVLALFSTGRKKQWHLKRIGPIAAVDGFFARLRQTSLIKYLFAPLQAGMFIVLLVTAFLNVAVPAYAACAALAGILAVVIVWQLRPQLLGDSLKVILYLVIPLIIYRGAIRLDGSEGVLPITVYRLSFGVLALLNILVSRLTRRVHGFQSTPLDFLVLIVVVAATSIPECHLPVYSLGLIAAKVIICYFSCEVVLAELRDNVEPVMVATLSLLVIIALRALV